LAEPVITRPSGGAGEQVELLVAGASAQQAKAQRARGDPLQQRPPGAPQQPAQRLDQGLLVRQRVGEAVGLHGLAGLGEGEVLAREDALGAEDHLHVVQLPGDLHQQLDPA